MNHRIYTWLLVAILAGCTSVPRSFTPLDPISSGQVSHETWNRLVRVHVQDGQVDYPAIQQGGLEQYLRHLNHVDPNRLSREDQLAFWINAYNAFAVKGILDHYSPRTLWGRYRYFIGRDYAVGGAHINLYDLERDVLIAQYREPRIHFAIVCASASCPKLQSWAYSGESLNKQLEDVTHTFINDPTRNQFDRPKKLARLSMIFKWFEEDFASAAGSVLAYVARYVDDASLANDLIQPGYRIEYLDYDWSLNGLPPKETAGARPS